MQHSATLNQSVLILGSVNADWTIAIDRLPKWGETILSTSCTEVHLGGKGANQAVAAARWNIIPVLFIGTFGSDANGLQLYQMLQKENIDLTRCQVATQTPTGQALIFLRPNGENCIVVVPGANHEWPESIWETIDQVLATVQVVMLQREIPHAINAYCAQQAHTRGIPVVYDMGGEETTLDKGILPYLTYICPNETELCRLTEMPIDTKEKIVGAAKTLLEAGVTNVLVTLGARGAILVNETCVYEQDAYSVDQVVDTTGAGDCFRSAFVVAVTQGFSPQDCLKRAAAASSICIQRHGATASLPFYVEIQERLHGATN